MPSVRAATDPSTLPIAPRGDAATDETRDGTKAGFSTALAAASGYGQTRHAPDRHDRGAERTDATSHDERHDDATCDSHRTERGSADTSPGARASTTAPASSHPHHSHAAAAPSAVTTAAAGDAPHARPAAPAGGDAERAATVDADADAAATAAATPRGTVASSHRGGSPEPALTDVSTGRLVGELAAAPAAEAPHHHHGGAPVLGDPRAEHHRNAGAGIPIPDATTSPDDATADGAEAAGTASDAADNAGAHAAIPSAAGGSSPAASTHAVTRTASGRAGAADVDRAAEPLRGGADVESDGGGAAKAPGEDADRERRGGDTHARTGVPSDAPAKIKTAPAATAATSRAGLTSASVQAGARRDAHTGRDVVSPGRHTRTASVRTHAASPAGVTVEQGTESDASADGAATNGRDTEHGTERDRESRSGVSTSGAAVTARDDASPAHRATASDPGLAPTADRDPGATDADLGARATTPPADVRDATGAGRSPTVAAPPQRAEAGSPWAERVVESVRVATLRGGGEMRLRLEPAGLGHIDVRITLTHDGIRAAIVAEHDATRALLRSEQHLLHAALERSDLRLAGFSVDVGSGSASGAFADVRDGATALHREGGPAPDAEIASEQIVPTVAHAPVIPGSLSVRV